MRNLSNSNNSKTKFSVMIAAFASVLLAGIGMSSPANASIINDVFPGINADDIGQSAECVGVAIECRENSDNIKVKNGNNNNGNGGNGGNGDTTCQECFEEHLSTQQILDLEAQLEVTNLAEVCANLDATVLFNALVAIGVDIEIITALFACLDLELPILG